MAGTISSVVTQRVELGTAQNPLTITSTGAVEVTVGAALYGPTTQAWTITNAGTVAGGTNQSGVGIDLRAGGSIANSGRISGTAYAVEIAHHSGTVRNTGVVTGAVIGIGLLAGGTVIDYGQISGGTVGVSIAGGAATVIDGGTISTAGAGEAVKFAGTYSDRLILDAGAVLDGGATGGAGTNVLELAPGSTPGVVGTLSGFGADITGFQTILVDAGPDWLVNNTDTIGVVLIDSGTLTNTGTISAGLTLANGASLNNAGEIAGGVEAIEDTAGSATVTNSGTVQGGINNPGGVGVFLIDGGLLTNTATGLIGGGDMGVEMAGAAATVVNAGTIRTTRIEGVGVTLGAASETLFNSGTIGGYQKSVYLQRGGVVYNSGLIGPNNVVDLGGSQSYGVGATPGADGIEVAGGAATVTNAGTIRGSTDAILFGGTAGFAGRVIADPGALFIGAVVGGTLNGATNVLELAAGTAGAAGTLSGFGTQFTGFGTLQIDSGSDWVVSGASSASALQLAGTANQTFVLQPGATFSGTVAATVSTSSLELASGPTAGVIGTLSGFGVDITGFQTILVDAGADWLVNNTDTIGVSLIDSGTLTNTGTISAGLTLANGASLNNAGEIAYSPLAITDTTGSTTVTNSGTVQGGINNPGGVGVFLIHGGLLTNTATGLIGGGDMGVEMAGAAATVVNAGTIRTTRIEGVGVTLGAASETLFNSGTIGGYQKSVYLQLGGVVYNSGLIGPNNVVDLGGSQTYGVGATPGADGIAVAGGAATVTNAGTIRGSTDAILLGGTAGFAGRVIADPGAVFIGAVVGGTLNGATNVLELAAGTAGAAGTLTGFGTQFRNFTTIDEDSGASWQVGGTFSAAVGVTMVGAADTLTIENFASFAASISGFGTTDLITLAGVIATQATLVGHTLELFDGASEVGTLDMLGAFAHERFIATPNGTDGSFVDVVPCFLRGTQVLTDAGERDVESLRIGDLVTTLTGASRPIKWIGRRSYAGWLAAGNPKVLPIRFKAGALADHVPLRDLFVSPEHAMYLDDALVPAGLLVNGSSITHVDAMEAVEYFHVELDSQDVIFAEGAPAETFVDDDSRGMFHNAFEFHELYPDATQGPARFCAPRIEDGFALEAVRRRLAERARRLRADGTALSPRCAAVLEPEATRALTDLAEEEAETRALALLTQETERLLARRGVRAGREVPRPVPLHLVPPHRRRA
jgi:hypothetical protein